MARDKSHQKHKLFKFKRQAFMHNQKGDKQGMRQDKCFNLTTQKYSFREKIIIVAIFFLLQNNYILVSYGNLQKIHNPYFIF